MVKLHSFGESLRDHYGHEEWFREGSLAEMMTSVKEHAQIEKGKISQNVLEKIERAQNLRHVALESLMKKFPTMKSVRYREELLHMKLVILKMEIKCEIKNKVKEIKNK